MHATMTTTEPGPRHPGAWLLICLVLVLSGCATTRSAAGPDADSDPYESVNRKSYAITDSLDRAILKPVAEAYIEHLPQPVRRSVGNFFDNVTYPNVVVNSFLQGKFDQGMNDAARFTLNTIFGGLGLFDVATPMGHPAHEEDFGQTLGVWGLDTGPYLFIPLMGPNSRRDAPGIPVGVVTNALFYVSNTAITGPLGALGLVDMRARLSGPMKVRDEAALDPYIFVREAYLQRRIYLIHDGNPPLDPMFDLEPAPVE